MEREFQFMENSPYDRFCYSVFTSRIVDREKFDKFHNWLFNGTLSHSSKMLTIQIASSILLAFCNEDKIQLYKEVEAAIKSAPVDYVRRAVAYIERYTDRCELAQEVFCDDIESLYNEMSLKLK